MVKLSITTLVLLLGSALSVAAQNCGPRYANRVCDAGKCCSQYGWCDTSDAHCNPANCLADWSGAGSRCSKNPTTSSTRPATTPTPPPTTGGGNTVPSIDICGSGSGGISCPGAGPGNYFYRCCSSGGHCGPKNSEQSIDDYCSPSRGCQAGFGSCDPSRPRPSLPTPSAGTAIAGNGENCGPIVNKRCATGLCCSGSNFCGTGVDYCGAANWCQIGWGDCNR